jgi:sugar/nucleoside kinase (ribokinase family)
MIVTQGKDGSIYFNKKNKKFLHTPAFETKPVDKVGAGDTLLTIFSIFFFITKCPHLSMLIASIAAGENVKNFANSYQLDQKNLIKIIQHILK